MQTVPDSIPTVWSQRPPVALVMGSRSDWPILEHAAHVFQSLDIPFDARIVSAHRTPERLSAFAREAESQGIEVIVAGAGGAAHLPGMVASHTLLPVLGVPIPATDLHGWDALLSIVQMPAGVPVGTLAIGKAGAINAAWLAIAILSRYHPAVRSRWEHARRQQTASVPEKPF